MKTKKNEKGQLTIDFLLSIVIFGAAFVFAFQMALGYTSSVSSPHELTQKTTEKIADDLVYTEMAGGDNYQYINKNNLSQIKNDLRITDYKNLINISIEVQNSSGSVINTVGPSTTSIRKETSRIITHNNSYRKIRVIAW